MMAAPSTLVCIPPVDVQKVWPAVAKMIDDAYAAVDQVTPDVLTWLVEGKGLLWVAVLDDSDFEVVAALTTSLVQRRGGLACRMVAAGAQSIDYCLPHLRTIELYAAREGCYMISCEGRDGWLKHLPGYSRKKVTLEKRL
jgi:hypothetical protein